MWARMVLLLVLLLAGAARADGFSPPGLDGDAQSYINTLQARFPAGGTPAARRQAEQLAAQAMQKSDWPAAVAALEQRVALGDPSAGSLLLLAGAQLRIATPALQPALLAAWRGFIAADSTQTEVQALLVIADIYRRQDRADLSAQALEAASDRAPDNATLQKALADARRAAGMVVRRVSIEPEADPARACLVFSVPPTQRTDFNPADWVRLTPPVPGAAITREGDQLCLSGLPSGTTTKVSLRAGMPGEQGLALQKATDQAIAMPNRQPRLSFDTRLFVLPRGQAPALTLTSINISGVKLKLIRLTERNVANLLRDTTLGNQVQSWTANWMAQDFGRVVWEGRAEIPRWTPNHAARTALPLPEALANAGPGLYALAVSQGDGGGHDASAVQIILRTDLAPTIWRGSDGLTAQIRSYADAQPKPGVRLVLIARNNDILAEANTDTQGVARFPAPLLRGEGPLAPAAIQAFGSGEDFAVLDLNAASFDLSDRGVTGQVHPGPLDAFVWLDRGLYRPGETVQVMALLRDAAGRPAEIPAQITIRRPSGQVFLRATPPRGPDAALHLPVMLSNGAAAGLWTVEVHADPSLPPIGRTGFRVDAFVPERLAVEFGTTPKNLTQDGTVSLPISARFLYGAPGAGLSGSVSLQLTINPTPFPAMAGYRFGQAGEGYAPISQWFNLPVTNNEGQTTLALALPKLPDTTQALQAELDVAINDPSGHASHAQATIPVRPVAPMIGIKPDFAGDAVDAGTQAGFSVQAVAPDGSPAEMDATLRLVREVADWRMVVRGSLARYETVWRDQPLETASVTLTPGAPLRISKQLDFGRYRLEVAQKDGLAITSYRFRSGWAGVESPDVPDRVDVSTAQRTVQVGQSVIVHVAPPFAGQATLLVLSDRVLALQNLTVPAGGLDVVVPVTPDWGPGAYVALNVYRPAAARPARAIGLVWVGVDPASRTLPVVIDTPAQAQPRARLTVPVHTAPGAWISLAAVDEGILRMTRFPTPDPAAHFLGQRRLGLDIRDDWGRLIAPAEGEATALRQGGDGGSFILPDLPLRTVTLFAGPVQAGSDGLARIPLDIPDFNGSVRLMAVAWQGSRTGAAGLVMTVRDPLVVEALLPRFLAPGDSARLGVLLHNLDLPDGPVTARITIDGPLTVTDAAVSATLGVGQQAVPFTTVQATGAGRGVIHLAVDGPRSFHLSRDIPITIRPTRGAIATQTGATMAPGASVALAPDTAGLLAGTWTATASFGAPVRYDVVGMMAALDAYGWACAEQLASKALPLALLADGALAGPDRAGRLQQAVTTLLDRQRYDGGFALWSATGPAEPWLSAYAMDVLLRARTAGAAIPDSAIQDGLRFLAEAADTDATAPEDQAAQAYRLYVLARAGKGQAGAARVLAESLSRLPTPLAQAQLGAALLLAQDQTGGEAAFAAALARPARQWWAFDYGTALRDQAAIVVLMREAGLAPPIATLPGADIRPANLSTQEQAWLAAAASVLGQSTAPAQISLDGTNLAPALPISVALTGPATARNDGQAPVWQTLSVTGVPAVAPPAAAAGMRVTRQFLALDGTRLDLEAVRQNTVFVLLLEASVTDGQPHRAMVQQGLPAGWEIAGRLPAGAVPGLPWLGQLSETEIQPAADDRFAAVAALGPDQPRLRVAVRVRAVTPGSYELPGAEVSDMYRPAVFARQAAGRLRVAPAD